jgi:hypothetical protein
MKQFLQTGVYTEGCIIPVTTEDPSLLAVLDDFSEQFRINIYIGSSYIDSITMENYRQICNSVSSIAVVDRFGSHLGNVWSLIQEQLYYVYARIHKSL